VGFCRSIWLKSRFFLTFYDGDGRGARIGFYVIFDRLVGIICVFFVFIDFFFSSENRVVHVFPDR